jgi:outer membrane lipoprotein SlyB
MKTSWLVMGVVLVSGCATNKPVLYSSAGTAGGGEAAIAECHNLAVAAGAQPTGGQAVEVARDTGRGAAMGAATGVVGGALVGAAGRGAGIGAVTGATAGLLSSLFSSPAPNPAYRAYVERCLRERGFDPVGWQ